SARNSRIRAISTLEQSGARARFSPDGQSFVFDRVNADGFYDLYIADLRGNITVSVTERRAGINQRHNGNGIYHPAGRYVVFASEEPDHYGLDLVALG